MPDIFVLIEVLAGWSPSLGKVSAIELAPQAKEPLSFNHTDTMANMEIFHVRFDFISYNFDLEDWTSQWIKSHSP